MSDTRTNAQKLHAAHRAEIKVDGCDHFIRTDKSELHALKTKLGGWEHFEVTLKCVHPAIAFVRVIPAQPPEPTPAEALSHSCARFELRRRILEFGHEHLCWPSPDDVDDELFDAAGALAQRALDYAASILPNSQHEEKPSC